MLWHPVRLKMQCYCCGMARQLIRLTRFNWDHWITAKRWTTRKSSTKRTQECDHRITSSTQKFSVPRFSAYETYVWGSNKNYNLGIVNEEDNYRPQQLDYFRKENIFLLSASISTYHSLFLDNQGKVYAVGHNKYGQLGRRNYFFFLKFCFRFMIWLMSRHWRHQCIGSTEIGPIANQENGMHHSHQHISSPLFGLDEQQFGLSHSITQPFRISLLTHWDFRFMHAVRMSTISWAFAMENRRKFRCSKRMYSKKCNLGMCKSLGTFKWIRDLFSHCKLMIWSFRKILGIIAKDFHSVAYRQYSVHAWGKNGGQFGISSGDTFLPTKVKDLCSAFTVSF